MNLHRVLMTVSWFLLLCSLLLQACPARGGEIEIFVAGKNIITQGRICGWLVEESERNETRIYGTVMDKGDSFLVTGERKKDGTFILYSDFTQYTAREIPEN